jgi:multidrug resistance efflux pump
MIIRPLFGLLLISLLLSACGSGAASTPAADELIPVVQADDVVIAEGRVEPVRFAEIALSASGLVGEVLVQEGQQVAAGDVIALLKSNTASTLADAQAAGLEELTSAYEEVRDAQFEVDNFDVPYDFAGLTPTEAVSSTLDKLNAARDAFEPYEDLSEKRLELTDNEKQDESKIYRDTAKLYKKRLDDAWAKYRKAILWLQLESDLETANARLSEAQKDYDSLTDPSFSEDTAGIRAALASAEVRAPFAGVITQLDLKVGEFAASGQPVVTIADTSSWVVKTTDLTELDVVAISEGQPVTITLDAIPEITIDAYVLAIGQGYSEKQGDIVYEVTILAADTPPGMRWGMTAEVRFGE